MAFLLSAINRGNSTSLGEATPAAVQRKRQAARHSADTEYERLGPSPFAHSLIVNRILVRRVGRGFGAKTLEPSYRV